MWNPSGELAMIDLDNGYFLIRFALESDMLKVLTGGPWVIYGHYLTVQPWSRSFSTAKDHPDQIVVWVRLPGLPYRYYTKSMFRCIAGVIGKIVRIDYNTTEGKCGKFARLAVVVDLKKPLIPSIVIDNFHQKIEYEGLPIICYGCRCYGHTEDACKLNVSGSSTEECGVTDELRESDKLEKFGPWMQVMGRRARKGPQDSGKFSVLANLERGNMEDQELSVSDPGLGADSVVLQVPRAGAMTTMGQIPVGGGSVSGEGVGASRVQLVNGSGSTSKASHTVENEVVERLEFASSERVVPVSGDSTLKPKVMPRKPVHTTEDKKNVANRQKSNGRFSDKVALGEWIGEMDNNLLQNGKLSVSSTAVEQVEISANPGSSPRWRDNTSFVSEGALCADFNRHLRLILRTSNPDVVALFETRVSGRKADRFVARYGFPFSFRVEANGFSGGIWLLWKHSVTVETSREFYVSFVYASPNKSKRSSLWAQLEALRPSGDVAWLLGGDFNAIASSSERMGGSARRDGISVDFNDFLQRAGLNDLGFHGARYTWKRGTLHQRLDRCLGSDAWWWLWPQSHVLHLNRVGFDHIPLLLETDPTAHSPQRSAFRYLAAWQEHQDFELLLSRVLSLNDPIVRNISNFQAAVSVWNKESFGHIGRRKRTLMARINGIERVNEDSSVPHFQDLEQQLKSELSDVLKQEEMLWFQHARTEWINDGDRNTKFYHRAAKARHRQNRCVMIKLDGERWCSDQGQIRSKVVEFFKDVFLSRSISAWPFAGEFASLEDEVMERLTKTTRKLPPSHCLFKIEDFSFLVKSKMNKYKSATFESGGYQWKLVLYPSGNKKSNGSGFISLYLEIEKPETLSLDWEVNVEFKFFVFDKIRDQYLVIKDTEVLVKRFSEMKTEWGISQLLSQKALNNVANGYLVDNCCTFGAEVLVIQHPLKVEKSVLQKPIGRKLTFKLSNFSKLDKSYKSPIFTRNGIKWIFQVFPDGVSMDKDTHLDICLKLADPNILQPKSEIYVKYKLRLRNQINFKHLEMMAALVMADYFILHFMPQIDSDDSNSDDDSDDGDGDDDAEEFFNDDDAEGADEDAEEFFDTDEDADADAEEFFDDIADDGNQNHDIISNDGMAPTNNGNGSTSSGSTPRSR
ncbi:hypothetical protein GQ457_15G002820 [Hibiscus cannabinus]